MTIYFGYDKRQVMQALRYHFLNRPEIRTMVILVNVFALTAITLYILKKIRPEPFLLGSFLWITLMVSFWYFLPMMVYRRAITFKHHFSMDFKEEGFTLGHEKGSKTWPWAALKTFVESPNFFHLYFDNRSFILVPKDGCRDKEEVTELREILKEKVKKKK